ncbi:MAG TPA: ABC transporter permease subunit [Ktedonosporobacter sp.]|nr:ABC transporter permease subunit [Ktedonosporobacter sp.]
MFRTIWSKSLRDYRVPILGWGIALALLMIVAFATATPAVLEGFASLAPILGFLGVPYALLTPEGYVTFRYMEMVLPLLLSFWLILAGARLVRGEEERGTLDVLLTTPQSRARLLLEKIAALLIASLLIALLFALGAVAGEARIEQHADLVRALLAGMNLSLFVFFFGMLALLISQFTISRGAAAGGASGLLLLSLLLDITGREVNGSWLQYLSPFFYYNLNRPLIPTFHNEPAAALLLVALSLPCVALSLFLFVRRDIGRSVFSWPYKQVNAQHLVTSSLSQAEHAISTRTVSLHALFAQSWSSFWWLLGIGLFCVYCIILAPQVQQPFYHIVQQTPWLQQLFFDTPTNTNTATLGTILFSFVPALVIIFALILALKWPSDLENGRLELVFSTPLSRLRIMLERFGACVLVILLAPILTWLTLLIGAQIIHLDINQDRIMAASFSMLPPALITIGLVYALAGRFRYVAVLGLVTIYLAFSFLEETLEGIVPMPSWIGSISIFHLYGNPIFLGMYWNNFLDMTTAALLLLLISLFQFSSADLELG